MLPTISATNRFSYTYLNSYGPNNTMQRERISTQTGLTKQEQKYLIFQSAS